MQTSSSSTSPPPSDSEQLRLDALQASGLLDAKPEKSFDRITRLAQQFLGVPVSLVSLVDADRQVFKSQQGLGEPWSERRETPLSHSFCQHVVARRRPLVVPNAPEHALVRENAAIRDIGVIAYLGVPIHDPDGYVLGTLCAIDSHPRSWTTADLAVLLDLAGSVETEIALRHALREQLNTERDLRDRESLLRLAIEAAEFGAWSVDFAEDTTYWNPRLREILGVSSDAQVSLKTGFEHIHPEDRARSRAAFDRALHSQRGLYRIEKRVVWPDGTVRWVSAWGRVLHDDEGNPVRMLGLMADVTERRRLLDLLRDRSAELEALNATLEARVQNRTAALRHRSEQVRTLTRALTLAEQRERRRIAHVLHDDLQQLLFGIQLQVQVTGKSPGDREDPRETSDSSYVHDLLERALTLTRTLSHELAPPALAEDGLEVSLAWLADQFRSVHGLDVEFSSQKPCQIPDRSLRALFVQLVRELLFNIVKHAETDRASLELSCEGEDVRIVVVDEGRGFDPAVIEHGDGFGMRSIRERVTLLDGELTVESAPEQGTRVTLRLPIYVDDPPLLDPLDDVGNGSGDIEDGRGPADA